MPVFEIEAGGKVYEVDAPDQGAALQAFASFSGQGAGAPAAPDEGALAAAGRGASQGLTFGLADEIVAAQEAANLPTWAKAIPAAQLLAPIIGGIRTYVDEDAAKRYDEALGRERRKTAAARDQHPIAATVGEIGGALATAPVLPGVRVAQGAGRGAAAANAAATSALYGGLYGAGTGEGAEGRISGAGAGAAAGAALGGLIGAVMPRGAAAAKPNEVVEAAENLGVQLPKAVASDGMATQWAGKIASNVPFAGSPLRKASEKAIEDIGRAAGTVADDFATRGGAMSAAEAGDVARTGLTDWIKNRSARAVSAAYDKVDELVSHAAKAELPATVRTLDRLGQERVAAALPAEGGAARLVMDGATRPGGLTYEGVKKLRSALGEMLDTGVLPADISKTEAKALYGALTADLEGTVRAAGGEKAAAAWRAANKLAEVTARRREKMASILGSASKSDEAVLDTIVAKAGGKSRADLKSLMLARKALNPDEWNDIASSVVAKIGRDPQGSFSPERFVTAWGNLSDAGKKVLFGGRADLAAALDDIATVSSRFKELNKFANPSGTGQQVSGTAIGAGLMTEPVSTIGALVGGNVLARILATPATAKSMASWARSYDYAVRRPAAGALKVLDASSRRFASDISRELGLTLPPGALSRPFQSAVSSDGQKDQR